MRLGTAALTLAFGLGIVGLAPAQESGNWLTRLFTSAADKNAPAKKLDVKSDVPKMPAVVIDQRDKIAHADLMRRVDICLKLREIAIATGDDDLLRKAEMLDQRANDLYITEKNQGRLLERPMAQPDAKKGGR